MRIRLIGLFVIVMLWGAAHAAAQPYYLALGDSLSVGIQLVSGSDVRTNQGYANDLSVQLGLTLKQLGCSGETTSSMIQGGSDDSDCRNQYPAGTNQLEAAESFLKMNNVALVTLDIGANDVDGCIHLNGIDQTCLQNGLQSVSSNLPYILRRLRQAARPGTHIVAMNYYDPFLAAWTLGANGKALALESLEATTGFNLELESIYLAFAVPVADVAQAFRIYNFAPVPGENPPVPVNVFLTDVYTYMSVASSLGGPDVHPNTAGYLVIAGAFAKRIASL